MNGRRLEASVRELAAKLPPGALSIADAERLGVSMDLWPRHILRLREGRAPSLPAAVVWPESIAELQVIMAHATATGLTLVPYGAGSSVVGGASPEAEHVVLDLKRMSRILGIDREALIATAEAGIMGELFERALARQGLTQGHFPSSIYCSTLGGWIAARGAGQMSSRYGKIEDQVLGGALVLGEGTLVRVAPSPVRSAFVDLMIGAEGTMALWAEASVRVHPLPETRAFKAFSFSRLGGALEAARAWLAAGLSPAVVRIYDPLETLLHGTPHEQLEPHDRGPDWIARAAAAMPRLLTDVGSAVAKSSRVIVVLQGSAAGIEQQMKLLVDIASSHGARDLGARPAELWYARRYAVSYRQSNALRAGVLVDTMEVACAWEQAEAVHAAVRRAGRAAGALVMAHFSHAYLEGVAIYFTYALPVRAGERGYDALWEACLAAAMEHGASVSHHHGVGRQKHTAAARAMGGAGRALAEARRAHDPAGVLNPAVFAEDADGAGKTVGGRQASELMFPARPDERLADVEARLRRGGRSLGVAAELFGSRTVLDVARRGWLWRHGPQLRVLEPLVIGVDGDAGHGVFECVLAPRSAVGPDLTRLLLREEVERVWLRGRPAARAARRFTGDVAACLSAARRVARDEERGAAEVVVWGAGEEAHLELRYADDALGRARLRACDELLEGLRETQADGHAMRCEALGRGEPLGFAGPWAQMSPMLEEAVRHGAAWCLACVDGVGAFGLVYDASGRALTGDVAERLRTAIAALRLDGRQERWSMASECATGARPALGEAHETGRATLHLGDHVHELDNCTYCPKLCRFACPVAVAAGSEALTPRQLALTASLARRGVRALSSDVAAKFFACVDCGGCASFCDHGNDVAGALGDARVELARQRRTPARIDAVLEHLRREGRMPDRPPEDDPASLLVDDGPRTSTWLFLGCQNGMADRGAVEALLDIARRRFGAVHVAAHGLRCCGHPLWRWGDREGFARHARSFAGRLGACRRLIVDDAGCAHALRELYPRVGVQVPEIISAAALLDGLPAPALEPGRYAPHDSCFARQYSGEPTLRERLGAGLARGSVLEGEAGCCGGMLLPHYDAALGERVARAHVGDLLGGGAREIITSSPTCRRRLRAVGAPVIDVFELLSRRGDG